MTLGARNCRVFREGDYVVIEVQPGRYEYSILLSRLSTPEKCLGWVMHLSEKTWCTPHTLAAVISAANGAHGKRLINYQM